MAARKASERGTGEGEGEAPASKDGAALLARLGERVRDKRREQGLTLRDLGAQAGVSERFLGLVEGGGANVSVVRLASIARALGTTASALLAEGPGPAEEAPQASMRAPLVALLGLRGAGKTTIGERAAARLGLPFVELDSRVSARAGMSLGEIFEMHGSAYFRRLEREELSRIAAAGERGIVATSGSLVTDHATFELLRRVTLTVWLRARPEDHLRRVIAQGDARPMENRADAMQELRSLLRARRALYERAAHVIDTSSLGLERSVDRLVKIVATASRAK